MLGMASAIGGEELLAARILYLPELGLRGVLRGVLLEAVKLASWKTVENQDSNSGRVYWLASAL